MYPSFTVYNWKDRNIYIRIKKKKKKREQFTSSGPLNLITVHMRFNVPYNLFRDAL